MNIIDRNFYRLLRSGALGTDEEIEPLSVWKWNRLFQYSQMHDVTSFVFQGLNRCRDQFFVQIPDPLLTQWEQAAHHDGGDSGDSGADDADLGHKENDLLVADHLTNPVLNRTLQDILDAEESNTETRTALLHLIGISRFIMNAGIPVKRVVELAVFLRQPEGRRVDFIQLDKYITQLRLKSMVQLTGVMLVKLMKFGAAELPFLQTMTDEQMDSMLRELLRQKNSHAEEWYFQQGKDIFVHTSNSQAMLWHVRRSAKYFRYYPAETFTNFFTSFAHSLSHIEE